MAEEDKLKEYMERLESLPGGLPSGETLRKLQNQCHLEPSDLKKLDMLVERHNDRAEIYLHRDNVIGAIEELERACQLTPRDPFIHLNLAKLYKNRYENYGFLRNDREKAKSEAEKTLTLDSTLKEPADIIREVDLIHRQLNRTGKGKKPVTLIILSVSLLLFILLFTQRSALISWIQERRNRTADFVRVTPVPAYDPTVPHDVPMNSFGFEGSNLDLNLQSSRITPLNDHWGYELKGGLSSPSLALDRAELELRFLDKNSALLFSENITLDEEALILPGETLPVNLFFYIPFAPSEVASLSVTPVSLSLLPEPPLRAQDLTLRWESAKPEGVKLELKERERDNQEGYDRHVHYYTFDLQHSGAREIRLLELTFRWRDSRENIIQEQKVLPVSPDGPFFSPGESRALSFHRDSPFSVNWDGLYYDVAVTDIELVP